MDKLPLTFPQQSIWDIEEFHEDTIFSNLAITIYLKEKLEVDKLEKAINIIIRENDALRLKLIKNKSNVFQYVPEYSPVKVGKFTFDNREQLTLWEEANTREPFKLIESELCFFAILRLKEEDALYVKIHHIIADAWAIGALVSDVFKVYWKLKNNIIPYYEKRPLYLDYVYDNIKYSTSEKLTKNKEFWEKKFATLPDSIGFLKKETKDIICRRMSIDISPNDTQKIKEFCKTNGVSEFILFFGLFALYLSKLSSCNDFVLGTPVLNRLNFKQKRTLGMFISNTPFRVQINDDLDFLSYLKGLTTEWKQILKNQQYSYSQILRDFRRTHNTSRNLFEVELSYQNATYDIEHFEYSSKWHFTGNDVNSLTLHISDRDGTGIVRFDYDYNLSCFTEYEIEQMHKRLLSLFHYASENLSKPVRTLPMLTKEDMKYLLQDLNQTQLAIPESLCVHQLFEEQVRNTPNNIAIIFKEDHLTYHELNARANQLANVLRRKGITRNTIVPVITKRSLEMIVAILAILKAGGAYLPIDPTFPLERIKYMLDDSAAKVILGEEGLELPFCAVDLINVKDPSLYNVACNHFENLENLNEPNDLAYLIYTSGSTGTPKGVLLQHSSVVNFIYAITDRIDFSPENTIASLTTMSFDIFVMETLLPLTKGQKVVIATEEEQISPSLLTELVERNHVNMLQLTPSRLQLILKDERASHIFKNLKHLFIGGEALAPELGKRIAELTNAEIYNMYGPTETTVWSTFHVLDDSGNIRIGKPIGNTQVYILNENMELVPQGVVGELYIGGQGLAKGYLNQIELTGAKFVNNPFVPGERLYRTGDLVRWDYTGALEYIGRNDQQVKIKGYRIELGEIEKCLLKHENVREAVVTDYIDSQGRQSLCAYLVGEEIPSKVELAEFLSIYLPNYMVPTVFTWLPSFPLTPNGKIDRKSLPNPQQDYVQKGNAYFPPRNTIDEQLIQLWSKILEVESISIDDNFFLLGGDSLNIVEVMAEALLYDLKLSAQDFYDYPTIRQLSDKLILDNDQDVFDHVTEEYPDVVECYRRLEHKSRTKPLKAVLLTGATGFLGIHVLNELLESTDLQIYCLVRGDEARIKDLFNMYFYNGTFDGRVTLIHGDITLKRLGLSNTDYLSICSKIDSVIHTAAAVKHYGDYKEFYDVNVLGTKNIIDFCLSSDSSLSYISTVSVSGDKSIIPNQQFTEDNLYIGQNYKTNVYVRTKFEAEQFVLSSLSRGLKASILRVGILAGRYSDGSFQVNIEDNAFYNTLRSMIALKAISTTDLYKKFEFTPVDYCAKAIVQICQRDDYAVFHLFNPNKLTTLEMLSMLHDLGFEIKILEMSNYQEYVKRFIEDCNNTNLLKGLILYLGQGEEMEVIIDCFKTETYLGNIGFHWPTVNSLYLSKLITHMKQVGFIEESSYGVLTYGV